MNAEWSLCKEHKYCVVCRRQNKDGLALRKSMRRTIDPGTDDFDCPDKLPWIGEKIAIEVIRAFDKLTDELELSRLVKTENDITPRFTPEILGVLVVKTADVKQMFSADHPLVVALNTLQDSTARSGGCSGCTYRRLMRQLAMAVDGCNDKERRKLIPIVTAT